jgi:hypothetical protein
MSAARQHSGQEQRSIDGGQFAFPDAFAGAPVDEVKEETVLVGQLVAQESKRASHPVPRLRLRHPSTVIRDAERGQAKAGRGDAGHLPLVLVAIGTAAVLDQARLRMRAFVEEAKTGALEVVEKLIVRLRKGERVVLFGGFAAADGCGGSQRRQALKKFPSSYLAAHRMVISATSLRQWMNENSTKQPVCHKLTCHSADRGYRDNDSTED